MTRRIGAFMFVGALALGAAACSTGSGPDNGQPNFPTTSVPGSTIGPDSVPQGGNTGSSGNVTGNSVTKNSAPNSEPQPSP